MQTGISAQDHILASTNNPDVLDQLQCPLVPDNCAPLNHWSYYVGHWLHRHIIHWFMASNCSKIKCPCCIMDTPLAPSPLKPTPPFIQTLLVVHCQQTCGKEIRAGEYSTHKCAEEPRPSDADVQTACHTVTGFHQLSTDRLREKGAESIHTKLTSCNARTIRYMTQLEGLSLIMKEHLLPIGPQNVAAIPPPDTYTVKFTIFQQYASLAQKKAAISR